MRSISLLRFLPVVLLLGASSTAEAKQSSPQAKERLAKKACLSGDPAKGVEILAELYVDTNNITYIFNQGRCFEQNRRYEDAVGRFREYLLKGDSTLSEQDKADTQKRIDACESYIPKPEPRTALMPEPVSSSPVVRPPVPVPVFSEAPSGEVVQRRQSDKNAGSGLRIAGIVAASVGVAALGAGLALNLKANSMASDLEKPDNFNRDTDASRKDYKTLSWVGYGVGAALLAGGSVMYLLGWRAGQSSSSGITVAPTFASGSAGVLLTGAF